MFGFDAPSGWGGSATYSGPTVGQIGGFPDAGKNNMSFGLGDLFGGGGMTGFTGFVGDVVDIVKDVSNIAAPWLSYSGQKEVNQQNTAMTREQMDWNAGQAQLNRDFQERMYDRSQAYNTEMSNSSWQRAVGDMAKAGLNPMLAYSRGGASAPTMAGPSGGSASAPGAIPKVNPLAGVVSAAQSMAQIEVARAQARNIEADTANKMASNPYVAPQAEADIGLKTASAGQARAQTELVTKNLDKVQYEIQELVGRTSGHYDQGWHAREGALLQQVQRDLARVEIAVKNSQIPLNKAHELESIARRLLEEAKEPGYSNQGDYEASTFGRWAGHWRRAVQDVFGVRDLLKFGGGK